jgi:hypothetical protein
MNPFTRHPQQQGLTYWEHLEFAVGIALRLLTSAVAFALHAVFPFIGIKPVLDLEETAGFMQECNEWIENVARKTSPASGETAAGIEIPQHHSLHT